MSGQSLLQFIEAETKSLRQGGLVRPAVELAARPGPTARVGDRDVVVFTSSDYLGLASHDGVRAAAVAAAETWGVGVGASRAALGTLALHTELEGAISQLLGTEDALVFASGHHANVGLFEALLGDRDYVFCDEMIRPSLADGIRLSRARAYAYRNADLEHLEDRLRRSRAARFRIIATDAVFPITGRLAPLKEIYALAAKYHALVVVDDSHGVGVLGARGEGAHATAQLRAAIDVVTGSFGNALGGGGGGFVAGKRALMTWLRQKSRPHLASTALAPFAAGAARKCLDVVVAEPQHRAALASNLQVFKAAMAKDAGLLVETAHPALSVLVRRAVLAQRLTDFLYRTGMFVMGYCHPVVPEGEARIGLRITARHTKADLEATAKAIGEGMKELNIQL